jgi:hypothetical protein
VQGKIVNMDDSYDYGDLVFLDQSQVFHEVLPVTTVNGQVGRMQFYVPTIPPNYMKGLLVYEGYPNKVFFTDDSVTLEGKKS